MSNFLFEGWILLLLDLVSCLNNELESYNIKDFCPNGLQIEGKPEIRKIVTGVTASLALIEKAVELNADAILVHHGYFWKNEAYPIVGMKKKRIQLLLANNISLLAYHLPLDVHATLGNNAQIGKRLELNNVSAIEEIKPNGIVMRGDLPTALSHAEFSALLEERFQSTCVSVGDSPSISSVAWCSGGGQGYIDAVAELSHTEQKVDAFLSGEISEQTTHSAREQNIDYFAIGHHASERYGVKALGEWLQKEQGLEVVFVDIHNPA